MSPARTHFLEGPGSFPRVSGDEPTPAVPPWNDPKFSPRERG